MGWENSHRRAKVKAIVFARDGDICHICHRPGADSLDHVIPQSVIKRLGLGISIWDPENLRPAHRRCNSSKGNGTKKSRATASGATTTFTETAKGW